GPVPCIRLRSFDFRWTWITLAPASAARILPKMGVFGRERTGGFYPNCICGQLKERCCLRERNTHDNIPSVRARNPGLRLAWSIALLAAVCICWLNACSEGCAAEKMALPEFLVRSWDNEDGLPSAAVRAIARTPDGYLWIATDKGLARFD